MEERILNALAGSPGKSAKEIARELGESTPIIMEHLLGLAASGALKQRTVGREQVFSIPKKAVPTPREILPTGPSVSELIDAGHLQPLKLAANNWPKQCPITRRDFFMEIDGVPTYGGPYDSYTIPEMTGQADQPWHERELFVRRYDHDWGGWVEDEFIPLRVIHEDVLMELEDAAKAAEAEPVPLATLPSKPTIYDRIGGTITLEIDDSPIKARFQSVEQLHRFLTDLIENERAGQVPEKGQV